MKMPKQSTIFTWAHLFVALIAASLAAGIWAAYQAALISGVA